METKQKTIMIVVIVAAFALLASNLNLTGYVPRSDKVSSLTATQDSVYMTVQLNPVGNTGKPNKMIDMKRVGGVKKKDEQTKCDDQGPKSGKSECHREIAVFDIRGSEWNTGDRVQFSIRGTNIKSPIYTLR